MPVDCVRRQLEGDRVLSNTRAYGTRACNSCAGRRCPVGCAKDPLLWYDSDDFNVRARSAFNLVNLAPSGWAILFLCGRISKADSVEAPLGVDCVLQIPIPLRAADE